MKKVISISLALLILIGGLGLTFGTHYCMGIPVKEAWMLGHQDLSCGMTSMESEWGGSETSFTKDCCDDGFVTLEGGDLFKQVSKIHVPCLDCCVFSVVYETEILVSEDQQKSSVHYHPPPPDVDITIAHQVFLI